MKKVAESEFIDALQKHTKLIQSIVKSHSYRCKQYGVDEDDLFQIASLTLWNVMKLKDTDDADFKKYLAKAIRKKIQDHLMYCATGMLKHERINHGVFSYVDSPLSLDGMITNTADNVAMLGSCEDDYSFISVNEFMRMLPHLHRMVLVDRMNGYGYGDVARRYGLSKDAYHVINRSIARAYVRYAKREQCDAA